MPDWTGGQETEMIMDNPGLAIFETHPEDEFRISFTVQDRKEAGGRRTLMTMRCFEEDKLRGVVVWLGEHQHLWAEWRGIAETEGGNAFSGHMADMMREDSLRRFGSSDYLCETCIGACAKRCSGKMEIELTMTLATRSLPIIKHAFKSARLRDAFMDFLVSEGRTMGSVELAELALLKGRNALAKKLDSIASRQLRAKHRTVH